MDDEAGACRVGVQLVDRLYDLRFGRICGQIAANRRDAHFGAIRMFAGNVFDGARVTTHQKRSETRLDPLPLERCDSGAQIRFDLGSHAFSVQYDGHAVPPDAAPTTTTCLRRPGADRSGAAYVFCIVSYRGERTCAHSGMRSAQQTETFSEQGTADREKVAT